MRQWPVASGPWPGRGHGIRGWWWALFLLLASCWLLVPPEARAARVFTCGFEENDLTTTMWSTVASGSPSIQTSTVRSGTYALRANQGGTAGSNAISRTMSAADTSGTYWVSFLLRIADAPDTLPQSLFIWGNGNSSAAGSGPIHIRLKSGPALQIHNVLTSTSTDGSTTLSLNTWYLVELKVVLGDSPNGSVELRLNGSVEALQGSTDTLDGSNGFNKFFLGVSVGGLVSASANYDLFFDDFKINDESGSFQNAGYPGDGKIALIKPASDNTITWTRNGAGCTGTSNADCVDDLPGAADDVTFNETGSANNVDRLNDTGLPAEVSSDADIILVDVYARFGGTGTTGTRQCRVTFWDEAGTKNDGPTTERCDVASGTFQLMRIGPTNDHLVFNAGTRTKADLDNADSDIGYENVSAHSNRISALWANVEWTEAPPATQAVMPSRAVTWQ